ncbi:restriction endonuclease [Aliifodinibius salicampi]|uniref:Restriction endonuclease n=1 Tax=Fodinibius salicampi TaxID=1920655 RepID=A0ABT3PXU2_9BACT|nr:restriction endonuclease [Fodinibius salicampi]MCW9712688.1 restriction endonuclease [Fodinibius salicampi]
MGNSNYWCYRIDTNEREFFKNELVNHNRLRQGWGWDEKQDLRNLKMDEGAKRNMSMLKVKKGDILLVPRLPEWNQVAIVKATEDWDEGYRFERTEEFGGYGHIFPAKFIKGFVRKNENVDANIRSTLKNPSRFWNINHYQQEVEKILKSKEEELNKSIGYDERLSNSINDIINNHFDKNEFENDIYDKLNQQFAREEWEYALVEGLQELFPFYEITREGGKKEKEHGTDILIKLPSLTKEVQLGIAIQVKDYKGKVKSNVIQQINKSEKYWSNENIRIIQKIVLFTESNIKENDSLNNDDADIDFIFAEDLKELLYKISINFIHDELSLND